MIIAIASGKGGTGKTTVAVNLALILARREPVQFLDCDAEEPNAHFFLNPDFQETVPVFLPVPEVDHEKCTACGRCAEICRSNALAVLDKTVLVFQEMCHGCGGCTLLCPEGAIREKDVRVGQVDIDRTGGIEFLRGMLDVGQVVTAHVIRDVQRRLDSGKMVIIDAPPGTSCPMMAAVERADFTLLVTEPTPFGLNDLVLAVETLRVLGVPHGVVINRADIGDKRIHDYCRKENIPILAELPYDPDVAEAYAEGIPIVRTRKDYADTYSRLFERIEFLCASGEKTAGA
ncbi:MAG: ATP-binding protein [Acidobacteria bacterium]|nr:ATP-binding protein [Acidobacteriota bacterium]